MFRGWWNFDEEFHGKVNELNDLFSSGLAVTKSEGMGISPGYDKYDPSYCHGKQKKNRAK